MPRPLRSSCDRCHSHKLKCPKQPGSSICTRCAKADAYCVFSPAGPAIRRTHLPTPIYQDAFPFMATDLDGGGMNVQFDWSTIETPPVPPQEPQTPSSFLAHTSASHPNSDGEQDDGRAACVRRLSTLSVEIDTLLASLPSSPSLHAAKGSGPDVLKDQFKPEYNQARCLENIFRTSQSLVELYPKAIRFLVIQPNRDDAPCADEDCVHQVQLTGEWADLINPKSNCATLEFNGVDRFMFSLVTGCHNRIYDMSSGIYAHAVLCARLTLASPDLTEPEVHIPELRVGNFVASASSSTTMQLALFSHLLEVLANRARQLTKTIDGASKNHPENKVVRLLRLECEILEERARYSVESFKRITSMVNKINLLDCD